MSKKIAVVIVGLTALCTSQGWAGSHGNGADQRRAAAGLPPLEQAKTTQYAFCYGGNVKVFYISGIITLTPAENASSLDVAYRDYVKATYGIPSIDRDRCVAAGSVADATAEKQRYEGMFGKTRLVEIEWSSGSSSPQ